MIYQDMRMLATFIVLSAIGYISAEYEVTLSSQTCGSHFKLEDTGPIRFIYNGAGLGVEKCSVSFDHPSTYMYSYKTCVKPVVFQLDCATTVEYHEGFIKNYIQPEKRFSCHNVSGEEWCCDTGRPKLYIVVKRNYGSFKSSDVYNLYISLNTVQHDYGRTSNSAIYGGLSVLPVFIVILIISMIVYQYKKSQRPQSARTPYAYQTTSLPMSSQIGHTPQVGYQPPGPQPQTVPQNQGGYQFHPMQTAYPSSVYQPLPQQEAGAQHSTYVPQAQQIDSVPHMHRNDAPPPAYESIVPQKH